MSERLTCISCEHRGVVFSIFQRSRDGSEKSVVRFECCYSPPPPSMAGDLSNFPLVAPGDFCSAHKFDSDFQVQGRTRL